MAADAAASPSSVVLVDHRPITAEGWTYFALMSVIWGVPYLFIKVAVEHVAPSVVVFGRSVIAAVPLLVIAALSGAIRPALRRWRPVVAFAVLEMAMPWILLTHAETHLPSGLTGLLLALVPLVGAVVGFALGDRHALAGRRIVGLALGLGGVALLAATDLRGEAPWWTFVEIAAVCVGYATAPFIASRRLAGVPDLGVVGVSLALVAVLYAPIAWFQRPTEAPPADAWWSVIALGVVCTLVALVVFFRLIATIGPTRATLFTFINPAVAVLAGALVLDERITFATLGGFVLVLGGAWLATQTRGPAPAPA